MLNYHEFQKDQARDLAMHLREHRLDTARIRSSISTKTRKNLWSVVVYVLDTDVVDDLIKRIRAVPPPAFDEAGRFARQLELGFPLVSLR